MRKLLAPLTCWVVLAVLMPGAVLAAEGLDARTRPLWERHWRMYAQHCAEFQGEFLCCPLYDRRYPSSAGMTVRQAEAQLSEKVWVGGGGIIVTKTVKLPIAEAKAMALPIPRIAVGQYGYLASVEVDEVLGPTSMQVEDLYLIDPVSLRKDYRADRAKASHAEDTDAASAALAYVYTHRDALVERQKDKRHRKIVLRLEGFSTDGLIAGERWSGPKGQGVAVLIVKPEVYGSKRRPRQRLVAVSVEGIRWGLDENAFVRLLKARGMDPASFVERVMEKMAKDDPDTARAYVFNSLLPKLDTSGDSQEPGEQDGAGGRGDTPATDEADPG